MNSDGLWGIALTVLVIGVCATWFYWCGYADRTRQVKAFAKATLRYAGSGFVLGIAFLTSDLGSPPMGLIAFTAGCGLLLYAAGWAMVASDDQSTVLVNLTGRALLLANKELAPFYTLPAPRDHPATELPPIYPRTCYVVTTALGQLGIRAGRTDMLTVDPVTTRDLGDAGLLVRRLVRPAATLPE